MQFFVTRSQGVIEATVVAFSRNYCTPTQHYTRGQTLLTRRPAIASSNAHTFLDRNWRQFIDFDTLQLQQRLACSLQDQLFLLYDFFKINDHFIAATYLDLDLGPPVPAGTLHDELSPSSTVAGNTSDFITSATAILTPIALMSSMNVSRHVRFGLPHLLHPPSGVQSVTRLAIFFILFFILFYLSYFLFPILGNRR